MNGISSNDEDQIMSNGARYIDGPVSSMNGISVKAFLGVMISGFVAIMMYFASIVLFRGLMGIVLMIVFSILYFTVFNSLKKDSGFVINTVKYIVFNILLGMLFGNGLSVSTFYIEMFAGYDLQDLIQPALFLSAIVTISVVVVGSIVGPRINFESRMSQTISKNIMLLASLLFLTLGLISIVGLILSVFGMGGLFTKFYSLIYGLGFFGMLISLFFVIYAIFMFLITIKTISQKAGKEPKYLEYYSGALLSASIISIYLNVFELVLKLLALSNKED